MTVPSLVSALAAVARGAVHPVAAVPGPRARDKSEALAITPGGGRIGAILSGSLNDQIADLSSVGTTGRLVDLEVGELEAQLAGLVCGGTARCLLIPANDLPAELWQRLRERDPVCLVTQLDGDRVLDTAMYSPDTIADAGEAAAGLFRRAVSDTIITESTIITVLWPVPQLVIIGAGAIVEALVNAANLLGWHSQVTTDVRGATGIIAGLAALDKVVVTSHDDELAGPALAAALAGDVGYIGALGSRRTQQSRADWLAFHGVTDLERVHGPAGLDIGANTPAEIAERIVAEALAARSGANATSLRSKSGAIH